MDCSTCKGEGSWEVRSGESYEYEVDRIDTCGSCSGTGQQQEN